MSGEVKKEFIPKERGSLPRVLLLDFDKRIAEKTSKESKFQVFEGKTGMVDGERLFPRDSSEVEIIFLDIGRWEGKYFDSEGGISVGRALYKVRPTKISPSDILKISSKDTQTFFAQVMAKGGSVVIFLGDTPPFSIVLFDEFLYSKETNIRSLDFDERYTTSLELSPCFDGDPYYNFFKRFIMDEDIKYYITMDIFNRYLSLFPYFIDEDKKAYAVVINKRLIISPKIRDLDKAVLFLLQDVFPFVCEENIYPDLHRFKWLEDKLYTFPEITEQEERIEALTLEQNAAISKEKESLKGLKDKYSYLQEMLYKDDSDSFEEGERLKDVVKKVLEEDLGFKDIKDMDKIRLREGLALKEDLILEDYIFTEVKGTERGAKQEWVDQLGKHVNQYCVATGTDISKIKQIIIFNHERRQDPQERTEPFRSDPQFLASCKQDKIALIPVFELFKLANEIKEKKITQEAVRDKVITCEGLFKI